EALRKRNIPYRIYGGLSFYQRKEIKDVIAYCRLLINPKDEEAFKRVINYPARGIGDTTLGKISDAALMHNTSMWQVLTAPLDYALKINAGTAKKLAGFRELIENLSELSGRNTAYEQVLAVVKLSGIAVDLQAEGTVEAQTKTQNIEELLKGVQEYCMMKQEEGVENPSLADFLSEVSLATDQDTDDEADRDKVTMMTIHSAKGLEFKHVFIVGMEEDLFPSSMAKMSARELEEERRLFYVALTRAEKSCTLTYSKSRFRHGVNNMTSPSRFLKDIDTSYLTDYTAVATGNTIFAAPAETVGQEQQRRGSSFEKLSAEVTQRASNFRQKLSPMSEATSKPAAPVSTPQTPGELTPGAQVQHERFGSGIVKALEGEGDNRKAIVQFETFGEKTLLLRFARLVIV
ncbi:MAG: ATP-dependent helicase, partial [Bacteroidales bacterium]